MANLIWSEAIAPNGEKYRKTYGWIPTKAVVREATRIESLTVDGSVEDYCTSRVLTILQSAMDKWFTPGSGHSKLSVGDLRSMALKAYGIPEIKDQSAGLILSGYDEKNDDPPKPPNPSPANIPNHDPAHDPDKNDHFHTPGPGRHGDGRVHVSGSANGKTPGTRGGLDGVNNGGDAYNQYDNKTLIKMLNAALKRPEDHIMNDRIQNILSQLSSNKKSGRVDTETESEEESGDEDATWYHHSNHPALGQDEDYVLYDDRVEDEIINDGFYWNNVIPDRLDEIGEDIISSVTTDLI